MIYIRECSVRGSHGMGRQNIAGEGSGTSVFKDNEVNCTSSKSVTPGQPGIRKRGLDQRTFLLLSHVLYKKLAWLAIRSSNAIRQASCIIIIILAPEEQKQMTRSSKHLIGSNESGPVGDPNVQNTARVVLFQESTQKFTTGYSYGAQARNFRLPEVQIVLGLIFVRHKFTTCTEKVLALSGQPCVASREHSETVLQLLLCSMSLQFSKQ